MAAKASPTRARRKMGDTGKARKRPRSYARETLNTIKDHWGIGPEATGKSPVARFKSNVKKVKAAKKKAKKK